MSILSNVLAERAAKTLVASRHMALQHSMTSLLCILGEESSVLAMLLWSVVEEISACYEGERRRREQALFDAYDDEGESADDEAESSQEVERMILGGDLIPSGGAPLMTKDSEEITFESGEGKTEKSVTWEGADDFVMFHESYESMFHAKPGNAQLGWDQYKVRSQRCQVSSHLCKSLFSLHCLYQ